MDMVWVEPRERGSRGRKVLESLVVVMERKAWMYHQSIRAGKLGPQGVEYHSCKRGREIVERYHIRRVL